MDVLAVEPEVVAQICHEANRRYCLVLGDKSQKPWEEAPWSVKQSAIAGVVFLHENPNASLSALHECWYQRKKAEGWVFGDEKDDLARTHPCMRPYEDLPAQQKLKDRLFRSIVQTFMSPNPTEGENHA